LNAEILKDGEIFKMMCTANKGKKECGNRQLRGQTRNVLAEHLEKESTLYYRTKTASELMGSDDDVESPHLCSASVCRNAKYEAGKKRYNTHMFFYTLAEGILISVRSLQRSEGDVF